MCKKDLIPGIRNSRQAPMDAICMASWVCFFLISQEPSPCLRIDRWMCIDSVLWKLCYVEDRDRNFHFLQHTIHHAHHLLVWTTSPELLLHHWLRFVEAFQPIFLAPVLAPGEKEIRICYNRQKGKFYQDLCRFARERERDLVCTGDMVVKKTRVLLGFMVESIQLAHVFRPTL